MLAIVVRLLFIICIQVFFSRYVPIPIKTVQAFDGSEVLKRSIHPLRVSFAMTIHKSQSLTLDKAIINIGKREVPFSLTYVALSRVRRVEDLLLHHVGQDRFGTIRMPNGVIQYLEKTRQLAERTREQFEHLLLN